MCQHSGKKVWQCSTTHLDSDHFFRFVIYAGSVPVCVISMPFGTTPAQVVEATTKASMGVLDKTYDSALLQAKEAVKTAPSAAVRGVREQMLKLFAQAESDVRGIVMRSVSFLGSETAKRDVDALVHYHFLQNYLVPLNLVNPENYLAGKMPKVDKESGSSFSGSFSGSARGSGSAAGSYGSFSFPYHNFKLPPLGEIPFGFDFSKPYTPTATPTPALGSIANFIRS